MRLESIALNGFKSFGERAVVNVLPGITGIVGPNGCGKSNISEAVRWALGEQSAKSLRGQRMEDLIFHGSASRKAVGLAEVELLFSNDGALSVPWSEVSVSRQLYRTGESEYLLNGTVSRLRDILDLFAGTGANPRAYSVMDQDKLNHVLVAKPHERRVFIEEAAGIARYKQQRNETQGKLEQARQNLVRVRDVMDEVRRQLNSLERQAKKAQQYKTLQNERRDLALALVAADYAALTAQAAQLATELEGLRETEQAQRTRVTALAAREARQREVIQASDHALSDLRQRVQKVQGELERLLERREQMGVQVRELGEESVRLDEEMRAAGERLDSIVGERETARTALGEAERLSAERAAVARVLEATVAHHRAALGGDRDRLEALRLEQVRIAGERVDLMRQAGELRERRVQLARRVERLAQERAAAEAEALQLSAERATVEAAHGRAMAALSSLGAERERLQNALAVREGELATAEAALADTRLGYVSKSSQLEALRALETAREGYGAGVRAIFDAGASLAGVRGTVADLLDVPPRRSGEFRSHVGREGDRRVGAEPRPPSPRPRGRGRSPRRGRGALAAQRCGGDLRHAGGRGALPGRPAPWRRPRLRRGRGRALTARAQAPPARAGGGSGAAHRRRRDAPGRGGGALRRAHDAARAPGQPRPRRAGAPGRARRQREGHRAGGPRARARAPSPRDARQRDPPGRDGSAGDGGAAGAARAARGGGPRGRGAAGGGDGRR